LPQELPHDIFDVDDRAFRVVDALNFQVDRSFTANDFSYNEVMRRVQGAPETVPAAYAQSPIATAPALPIPADPAKTASAFISAAVSAATPSSASACASCVDVPSLLVSLPVAITLQLASSSSSRGV
jgi:hypothetical protein